MANKRPSPEAWAEARARWEADPTVNFESLARDLGVSAEAPRKRAKSEGWARIASLSSINERAQFKADAREVGKLDGQVGKPTAKTTELAEDIRADVLERHRSDWAEHRQHFKTPEIAADFDKGKSAKISAEMLLIRQRGERAAYGLDEGAINEAKTRELSDVERAARVASIIDRARSRKAAAGGGAT